MKRTVSPVELLHTFRARFRFIRRSLRHVDRHGHRWYCFHLKCRLAHKDHRSFDTHCAMLNHVMDCHREVVLAFFEPDCMPPALRRFVLAETSNLQKVPHFHIVIVLKRWVNECEQSFSACHGSIFQSVIKWFETTCCHKAESFLFAQMRICFHVNNKLHLALFHSRATSGPEVYPRTKK